MAQFKELHTPAGTDFWVDLETGKYYTRPDLGDQTEPNGQMIGAYGAYKQAQQQTGVAEPTKEQYLTDRYLGNQPSLTYQGSSGQAVGAQGQPAGVPAPRTLDPQSMQSSAQSMQTSAQSGGGSQEEELYNVLKTYLEELRRRGMAVNPDVIIDEKMLAEFLKKAEGEISPYYQTRLALARDQLLRQFGYTKEQIAIEEQRLEKMYGRTLQRVGETAAEKGFAQSGQRVLEERDLAEATQQQVDDRRRQLEAQGSEAAAGFAGQFGTANLPQFSYGQAPRALAGESNFSRPSGERPFYSLSSNVYDQLKGTEQFQQTADIQSRASQLEEAERIKRNIANTRTLVL